MTFSKKLDNKENYRKNTMGIGAALHHFPKQCSLGLSLEENISITEKSYDYIFLCGVGGSGLAADFVYHLGQHYGKTPLFVVRDYALPSFVTENSLCILLSYSGNTEEVLSCYKQGKSVNATLLSLSSGGILAEWSKEEGESHIDLPKGFQPRMATLYLALPIITFLMRQGIFSISHQDFGDLYFHLLHLEEGWKVEIPAVRNRAKVTALQFYNKIPIVWGSSGLTDIAARAMKNQLNETAKSSCFYGEIPEVNHNELMTFAQEGKNTPILLFRDKDENPRVSKRFELCKKMLEEQSYKVLEYHPKGNTLLSRMAESLYFGNWVAFYLAVLKEVNPEEIPFIEDFKIRMSR